MSNSLTHWMIHHSLLLFAMSTAVDSRRIRRFPLRHCQDSAQSSNGLMNLTYGHQATAGQSGTGSTAGDSGQLMSISGTINQTTESAAYAYDDIGRLVTSNQTSNGSSAQRRFAYDRWGNRTGMWMRHQVGLSFNQSACNNQAEHRRIESPA